MVLAAGLGTRMRPFNGSIPKPLVKVGNKSLIDYVLDRLAAAGVEQAVVNIHHMADQIERHLAGRQRPHIVFSDERAELLGTAGGIVKALPLLGDEPFFLVNSDTIWIDGVNSNLARLAAAFDPERMDGLLLLAPTTSSIGYTGRGDFKMAPDGKLTRRGEREVVPFVYAGAAILRAGVRGRRAAGAVVDVAAVRPRGRSRTDQRAAARRRLDACRHAGGRQRRRSRHRRQRRVARLL